MDVSAFSGSLDCSVCLEVFKSCRCSAPLVLNNCGYSVCSKCVKKLIDAPPTRRTVVCPECRTISEVPADGFKKNYRLADIIAKLEESGMRGTTACYCKAKHAGKWRLVKSENFDEYLKEVGVGVVTHQTVGLCEAESVKPVLVFDVNGEHWKMTVTSASRTASREFHLDKEVVATISLGAMGDE